MRRARALELPDTAAAALPRPRPWRGDEQAQLDELKMVVEVDVVHIRFDRASWSATGSKSCCCLRAVTCKNQRSPQCGWSILASRERLIRVPTSVSLGNLAEVRSRIFKTRCCASDRLKKSQALSGAHLNLPMPAMYRLGGSEETAAPRGKKPFKACGQ